MNLRRSGRSISTAAPLRSASIDGNCLIPPPVQEMLRLSKGRSERALSAATVTHVQLPTSSASLVGSGSVCIGRRSAGVVLSLRARLPLAASMVHDILRFLGALGTRTGTQIPAGGVVRRFSYRPRPHTDERRHRFLHTHQMLRELTCPDTAAEGWALTYESNSQNCHT